MGSHWAHQMGGAQYQAKCIVEALQRSGRCDIHYLASNVAENYTPTGYRIHRIGRLRIPDRFGGFIWDALGLRQVIRTIRPDLVYQRGLKAHTGFLASICKKAGIPFVFHIAHDDDVRTIKSSELFSHSFNRWANKRIGEKGLYRATAIIAQTQIQGDQLHENYGIKPVLVAPNFHPVPESAVTKVKEPVQVTWVANFKPSKQPQLFVDLAESMVNVPNLRFVMIGRRGDSAAYSALHERIASLPNLNYLGEVPIERVNDELTKSHIFVNTSVSEGFPNTFIQAWMRAVPVVSLFVDPDKVLQQQKIGVCCHTTENLRAETLKLVENSAYRDEMGLRAAQWAARVYGPSAGAAITDLLLTLASERRTKRI